MKRDLYRRVRAVNRMTGLSPRTKRLARKYARRAVGATKGTIESRLTARECADAARHMIYEGRA